MSQTRYISLIFTNTDGIMFHICLKRSVFILSLLFLPFIYDIDAQEDIASDFLNRDGLEFKIAGKEDKLVEAYTKFAKFVENLEQKKKLEQSDLDSLVEILRIDSEARLPLAFLMGYYLDRNEPQKLLDILLPLAKDNPSNDSLALAISLAYARLDKIDDSIAFLEKTLEAIEKRVDYKYGINYVELIIHLAELYLKKEDFEKGEELFDDAFEKEELHNNKLRRAAFIFFSKKAEDRPFSLFSGWQERRFYRKMLEQFSYIEKLWFEQLDSATSEDQPREDKAFELAPIIQICKKFSLSDKIENMILEKLLSEPKNTGSRIMLALFYQDIESYANGRRIWREICEENKSNYKFYMEYGRAALASKKYDEAIRAFEWAEFISKPQQKESSAYLAALAYMDAKKYEKAISRFERLKNMPEAYYFMAYSYRRLGDIQKAADMLDEAEKVAEANSKKEFLNKDFYMFMAFTNDKAKRYDRALQILEKLYAQYPEDNEVCNFYGYFLADHNKKLETAEEALKKAITQEPDNAAYIDSIAWLYYRQGKYEEAYHYIKEAIQKMEEHFDGLIYDHAGDICFALKKYDEALIYWRQGIEYYSEDTNPEEILKKIESLQKNLIKK